MPSFTCPNCAGQMESDVDPIRGRKKSVVPTHVCTSCGYTEKR